MIPKNDYSPNMIVTIKMPPHLLKHIDKMAQEMGISRSELIRLALYEFLLRYYWKPKLAHSSPNSH